MAYSKCNLYVDLFSSAQAKESSVAYKTQPKNLNHKTYKRIEESEEEKKYTYNIIIHI